MLIVFTVTQLCGGKEVSEWYRECLWTLPVRWPVNCLSASAETVSLRTLSSSAVWPSVFPSCLREGAETCALSCCGCYNMRYGRSTKVQGYSVSLSHGWSPSSSTQRVSSNSVGGFSPPNFSYLNSKTGTAQSCAQVTLNATAQFIHLCSSHYET